MKLFISIFQAIEEITSFESLIYRRSAWFIELFSRSLLHYPAAYSKDDEKKSRPESHPGNVIKDDIKNITTRNF